MWPIPLNIVQHRLRDRSDRLRALRDIIGSCLPGFRVWRRSRTCRVRAVSLCGIGVLRGTGPEGLEARAVARWAAERGGQRVDVKAASWTAAKTRSVRTQIDPALGTHQVVLDCSQGSKHPSWKM